MLKNIIIFFFISSWSFIMAQEPNRYTTKQGLPSNHIYDLAEDENGFMWFATKQGLVKYDGETFKTLTIKDGLPNNDTWLLELDYEGRLWFFSKSKYQGYVKKDSLYKLSAINKEVISPRYLYKSREKLWFYGNDGLKTFNNKNIIDTDLWNKKSQKEFDLKVVEIQKFEGFDNGKLMPALPNPETQEYIFLQNKKLLIYDWNLNFKKELLINIPLEYENIKIDNQGLLYNQIGFFAMDKGILFIDFKKYKTVYKSYRELIGIDEVKYFRCFSTKKNIQISVPGYLMIFDYKLNLLNIYNLPIELSNKSYKDSKGNIWMTDLANGISLFPNTFVQSEYYLKNQKVQKINNINNNLFVGITDNDFYIYDKITNNFKQLNKITKANGEIYQIKEDTKGNENYLISASKSYKLENSFLISFNFKNNFDFNRNIDGIKDISVLINNFYIITSASFVKYNSINNEVELEILKTGLLFTEPFKNQIYAAGSDGLHKLDNKKLVKPILNNSLLEVPISSLKSTEEYLIVGTDGRGVYLYDSKNIYHLKETDGLSVQRIIQKGNNLWLATQKGVYKIQINNNKIEKSKIIDSFYNTDGLLQNNTNDIYIENDTLYAASDVGLAKINLANSFFKQKPNLYFKTKSDTLQFKNGARDNVSITFASLDFTNQEHLKYSYRLSPLQENWIETTNNTLNFSNLAPKLYTLEVKVMDQHFNQSIHKLHVDIIPEWWQTIVAKIIFGILFILLFFGLIKIIKSEIRKKEVAKAQQEKRIAGLELQALRSQMNPHFVHNSLNAIQYFIQRNEVELSENYLSKFSQLIRLFFEYSRRQNITIKEELDLLKNYLEIEKIRFEEKLNYSISICNNLDLEEHLIPSMLLQPIIENAVNHGIFHKKENGNVNLSFKKVNDCAFEVVIEDDGIGINKSKALLKASSKNYQSNSSKVLQERLELLNQSKEWNIRYEVLDKFEINNSTTGTIITLLIKQNL